MYNMISNFYPAAEKKNGYIGKANLIIAGAIRINDISVFEKEDGGINISFPEYGEGKSFVIPASKDAYAAMLNVVEGAVRDEKNHFGHVTGKYNPSLSVKGGLVNEPHADARFSLEIADLCTLRGISTKEVTKKDGKTFVAVDVPNGSTYEKDGKTVYPKIYEGLKSEWEKDGEKQSKNFATLINNLIKHERKELLDRKPSLDAQVQDASDKSVSEFEPKEAAAPSKDMER